LLRRNPGRRARALVRSRIELSRRKFAGVGKAPGIGFLLKIKCANGGLFIYGRAIGDELFVLRSILQTHVGLEEAVDKLALLILSAGKRKSNREQ